MFVKFIYNFNTVITFQTAQPFTPVSLTWMNKSPPIIAGKRVKYE